MDEKRVEKAMRHAKKSLEFENMHVSEEQEKLVRERQMGNISHEEFIKRAVKLANE